MEFVIGLVLFCTGLWIMKSLAKNLDKNVDRARDNEQTTVPEWAKQLERTKGSGLTENRIQADDGEFPVKDSPARDQERTINVELSEKVALDAMHREHRAKMALIAVLRQQGCTEEQILSVLTTIDDPEKTAFPGSTT